MDPFDFSNQYTNIAYYKLKSVMGELINFSFNSVDEEFIEISRYGAIRTNRLSFNKKFLN